ncbi:MAG: MOSC domain-containing protein [Actinomycetota bacterium]
MEHRTEDELTAALPELRAAPADVGRLEMIVRRPAVDEREVLEEGELDLTVGLVGDTWQDRGSSRTDDGSSHPDMQLNVMSARMVDLIAGSRDRWALAGDQLYVDLDLSGANLPPGTRLHLGDEAVIEVTDQPHLGCAKFTRRFGLPAHRFVNSELGKELHLRGINAKVAVPGTIRAGDQIKVERPG